MLREVSTLVRGPFRQRGVSLELVEADRALPVRLDPVHGSRILAQVLNALRAGLAEGASLVVSAGATPGGVEVRFEPDEPVAVDETRRDDWMASGMGLWVARRLLHELGGRLEQPVDVPVSGTRPATEEAGEEAPPPLDVAWRVWFPEA